MKLYRVTLQINEIVEANNEEQAIELVAELPYKLKADEIVTPKLINRR